VKNLISHILLILIPLPFTTGYSQDFHFTGFMHNQVYINPAYVAMPVMNEFSMTYRNQWPGMEANFVTYGAAFIQPMSVINSGIGVAFIRDMEAGGVFSRTSANLFYGYSFEASRELQVYTGLEASYVYRQFTPENLRFASDILNDLGTSYPPVNISAYTRGYPDFSAGIMGSFKKVFMLGLSASHVTQPRESFSGEPGGRLPVKFSLYSSYRMPAGGKYNQGRMIFIPALMFVHQGNTNELVWGTAAEILPFTACIWLRQNFSLNFSSLLFSAGILQKKYTFLYSYDVNLTRINFLSTKMGSHEVTFLLRFEYKRKKFGAVKCT
jgi:type IX secretion system PorP/SprF family membrane protein